MSGPRTLYDKIWDSHLVEENADGTVLLYIDCHLILEVTSPQAFEGLRARHLEDEMAVDVEQHGAVLLLLDDMAVPDLVVQRARPAHGFPPTWVAGSET